MTEKDLTTSDTLDRSNLVSLQSDVTTTNKSSEISTANDANLLKFPCKYCVCQQHSALGNVNFIPCQKDNGNTRKEWQRSNWKWPRQSYLNKKDKYYDIKPKNKKHMRDKVACCDVLDGIPGKANLDGRNVQNNPFKPDLNTKDDEETAEKIEIYYFDHGNSAYYHTTDIPPILTSEKFGEKAFNAATQFWAEIFGFIHIGTSFITTFILQLIRYILLLIRPLTVGVVQLIADYFMKPLLSITFNGLIQPILILLYNVATSFRDCCEPVAAALGFFMKEVATLFRSCRLIEITHNHKGESCT